MKTIWHRCVWALAAWLAGACLAGAEDASAAPVAKSNTVDLVFESLQIGSRTFSNVTVTAQTPTDVFVRHRMGIANFKPEELPADIQRQLGYRESEQHSKQSGAASLVPAVVSRTFSAAKTNEFLSAWAKRVKARIAAEGSSSGASEGEGSEEEGSSSEGAVVGGPISLAALAGQTPQTLVVALSFMLVALPLFYFFFCYTARLICQKAGCTPGPLIWFPVLSLLPLIRAARLPAWTFALFLLPIVNILFSIVWSVKIAQARGKSILTALCLIFPITSPIAWLYLAYSK